MILRKNKTKFRRPAHKGSLKARHGAEIRIAVPVPGKCPNLRCSVICGTVICPTF